MGITVDKLMMLQKNNLHVYYCVQVVWKEKLTMNIHVESIMSQELNLRSLPGIYLIMCFTTQLISKLISIVHIVPTTTTE